MPIKVVCPQCNKSLNAPDNAAGRTAKCPKCKGQIRIPGASAAGVPVAAVVGSAAAMPVAARALGRNGAHKAAERDAFPSLDPLPALDPLGDADPFAGLSLEAFGGEALAGEALPSSPLAALPATRRRIDLLPLLVIGGGLLVIGLLFGGVFLLIQSWGPNADWLRFMPDEAQAIVHVDLEAVRASGLYDKIKQVNPAMEKQIQQGLRGTSLQLDDLAAVSVGGTFQDRNQFVAVLRTNRSVSEDELHGGQATRQESVGEYTIHHLDKYAGVRIDDNTLVTGTPELVEAVLLRNGPARFAPALQSAVDDAGFSSDITVVMTLQGLPGMNRTVPGAPFDPKQIESLVVSAELGSSIDLEAGVFFQDASTASSLKEMIDAQMSTMRQMAAKMPPQAQQMNDILNSLSISRSGRKLSAEVTIPRSVVDQAASFRPPTMPAPQQFSAPSTQESPPVRSRRGRFNGDSNLPPTAPSRGLF
jgi:hypothetical protein